MQNPKTIQIEQQHDSAPPKVKESYVKPQSEIVKLELEQPILNASNEGWNNGDW